MTTTTWTSAKVRETFLSYFESKGHRRVPSSPLLPAEDPTLLFTNAGMNQFKDVFLGRDRRDYVRATTAQKCVRAGGKHNDLANVGYTARHHTFFEMLGNFSFGDYFKKDAIDFAWELVTSKSHYGLDPDRLWATVYLDDDEAAGLWEKYLPKGRIARFGEKDNFWSMGDTGPCGPCSEIHYDQGSHIAGDATPNGEGDRVMELWNLVFMQFDRDANGKQTPLPKPSVDTGAGLERITAILDGKNNNYDTDLFAGIIGKLEELSGRRYLGGMAVEDAPFRVVADHVRAATMLVTDGIIPSNKGRGDVLRKIIKRATRYGRRLGLGSEPFLHNLLVPVIDSLSGVYFPVGSIERYGGVAQISSSIFFEEHSAMSQLLRDQEARISRTVNSGADRVGEEISNLRRKGESTLSGATVFRFTDTYGIPIDLVEELAQDEGVKVDRAGFEAELEAARERSRGSSKFEATQWFGDAELTAWDGTVFRGYPEERYLSLEGAQVRALFNEDSSLREEVAPRGRAWVLLNETVFYPEGGGQVADRGEVLWRQGRARVLDVQKPHTGKWILHLVEVEEGTLRVGEKLSLRVDEWMRRKTQANHTGTHLLHAALRNVLGESVRQMGSLVAPDRLRFDYASSHAPKPSEVKEIERIVNEEILRDRAVGKEVVSMDEAKAKGAIMFFGEKYGERVRVVDVPGFSTELCGGCHVTRTGEIGGFKIVSDKGLAAGVRRLEAVTSLNLVDRLSLDEEILAELSDVAQTAPEDLPKKLREQSQRVKDLEKEVARLKVALATGGGASPSAADEAIDVAGVKVLAKRVPTLPAGELRNLADTFRGKLKSGVVLLGTEDEGKVTLLAAVTPDLMGRVSAHELAQAMAPVVGGKGGGKPDLAQAGGKDPEKIDAALAAGVEKVRERLRADA